MVAVGTASLAELTRLHARESFISDEVVGFLNRRSSMSSLRSRVAATCFAAILFTFSGPAQVTTSTIAGVVTDQTGSVVTNARIVATVPATGQQRGATTNSLGEYVLAQLAPGVHRVTVTATGFQTSVVENLTLDIAQRSMYLLDSAR
jgi:hypothetical protein